MDHGPWTMVHTAQPADAWPAGPSEASAVLTGLVRLGRVGRDARVPYYAEPF